LAVALGGEWTYIEVKTRSNGIPHKNGRASLRQVFFRELIRLRAHSLRQLPRKHQSLMVLATSASPNRRQAISKIFLARSFAGRIFYHDSQKILGFMIFAPFKNPNGTGSDWKYASALIPNPNMNFQGSEFDRLGRVQL